MRRNEVHYSKGIWWATGINIATNIRLVPKHFAATEGTILKDDTGNDLKDGLKQRSDEPYRR